MPARQPAPRPPAGPGFLARVARLAVLLALAGVIVLVLGFKLQRGAWAWQDHPGFQAYCGEWWGLTRQAGTQAGGEAHAALEASGVIATTEDLIARAKRALAGDDTPPTAAAPTASAATAATAPPPPGAKAAGSATPAPAPQAAPQPAPVNLPPGYLEAYKAGYEHYRDGLVHFKESMPHTASEQKELLLAKAKFEAARDEWQRAEAIYDKDEKLAELQQEMNLYLVDVRKRIKPAR